MSRTRIIKGKYIKTVGENYNITSEGNIFSTAGSQVQEKGVDNGVQYGNFERLGSNINDDFEISFSLKKDGMYSTVVPFGILDFEGNYENANFAFNYSLSLSNIDTLEFKILNEDGSTLYAITNLPEFVVTARRLPLLAEDIIKQKLQYNPLKPVNVWDWKSVFDPYNITSGDYTKIGSYIIFWDGFDNNGIYDSTKFNDKKLKAVIIAKKNGKEKTKEVEFSTNYEKVDWVDVKIDKNNKRIDTTLRVNLKDGGAEGLECSSYLTGARDETHWEERCPWDKIPKKDIIAGKSPIKERTRSFGDLEKLALDGLNYHWGRNKNHAAAKDVKIIGEGYEVYVSTINTQEKSMDDVSLIYNTNGAWKRSGNPGSFTLNPITWIGNLISREAICYNVGYLKGNTWRYREEMNEDIDFKFTSAHEIGHEILKSFGGTGYSYGHKGSVNVVTQSMKDNAPEYPSSGEIDIMPYYPSDPPISIYNRYAAAEKDVLSLIWLTKIKIN
ncbi:hypothetical protein J3D55_001508 [Chryseobacterium ginsenosidimutans]|uniref:hypothetical protein n=1 Tax=Chryseobacterium ginsenosidimutans TaxID=687846 RepID=UPI00216702AC|nr:hypothetical protein [Chryseobacterium ginsenosidimutans]MCS3868592.1 hypothetical protein [Chryseobacterium ginsenosidimutans]